MSDPYYDIVVANDADAEATVSGFVQVTQAEYDLLTPDDDVVYVVVG